MRRNRGFKGTMRFNFNFLNPPEPNSEFFYYTYVKNFKYEELDEILRVDHVLNCLFRCVKRLGI